MSIPYAVFLGYNLVLEKSTNKTLFNFSILKLKKSKTENKDKIPIIFLLNPKPNFNKPRKHQKNLLF
ncbi:hypothetical protein DM790_10990 [Flavobacterium collinsii]|nr:hypothetical protein [Flavobacterium collinsii]